MSVYLHRLVEAKGKDGNWRMLRWYSKYDDNDMYCDPDPEINASFPMVRHEDVCDNACVFRELLSDNPDFSNRGLPSDVSNDVRNVLGKYEDYMWGVTSVTLSELRLWSSGMRLKLVSDIRTEYDKACFGMINKKLDCLINGTKYIDETKASEDGMNAKSDMLRYYLEYGVEECMSLINECCWVDFLSKEWLNTLFESSENIRVIYFYT